MYLETGLQKALPLSSLLHNLFEHSKSKILLSYISFECCIYHLHKRTIKQISWLIYIFTNFIREIELE